MLDASAALDYLVDGGERGQWARKLIESEAEVVAPHLVDLEVLSGLRKLLARKNLTARRAAEAITDFRDLALVRYPLTDLLERLWELRATLTPYDAAYVVLSEALGVALVTTDVRLTRSHGHGAEIVSFAP